MGIEIDKLNEDSTEKVNLGLDKKTPIYIKELEASEHEKKIFKKWGQKELVELDSVYEHNEEEEIDPKKKLNRFREIVDKHVHEIELFYKKVYSLDSDSKEGLDQLTNMGKEILDLVSSDDLDSFLAYMNISCIHKNKYEAFVYMGACYQLLLYKEFLSKENSSFFTFYIIYSIGFYFVIENGGRKREDALDFEKVKNSVVLSISIFENKIISDDFLENSFKDLFNYFIKKNNVEKESEVFIRLLIVVDKYIKRLYGYDDISRFSESRVMKEILNEVLDNVYARILVKLIFIYPLGSILQFGNNQYGIITKRGTGNEIPDYYLLIKNKFKLINSDKDEPITFSVSKDIQERFLNLINDGVL